MPITATQLEKRKAHLGSSDIGALLGVDAYRNRYDLYLEKTGKVMPEKYEGDNNPKVAGQLLEPAVLQFAENRLGAITRNQYRSAKDKGLPIAANVDAILNATGQPIEAKTSGLYGFSNDVFGDENTDQVPDRIILQSQAHLLCTDADICFVPVFIAFRGFVMFQIPRDQELIDVIGDEAMKFWQNNVLADIPPDNLTPNLAVVKRVRREPSKIVPVDSALIESWQKDRESRLDFEKREKESLAAILASIGDAEGGECEHGTFTYMEQMRAEYTVKATAFRVARFKKNK